MKSPCAYLIKAAAETHFGNALESADQRLPHPALFMAGGGLLGGATGAAIGGGAGALVQMLRRALASRGTPEEDKPSIGTGATVGAGLGGIAGAGYGASAGGALRAMSQLTSAMPFAMLDAAGVPTTMPAADMIKSNSLRAQTEKRLAAGNTVQLPQLPDSLKKVYDDKAWNAPGGNLKRLAPAASPTIPVKPALKPVTPLLAKTK